jgi:single-stranded-DNA-specific exonuclease
MPPDTHKKRWFISPTLTPIADAELASHPAVIRQALFNRGYATRQEAYDYLSAREPFDTNPFQMTGIPATVDRIAHALDHHEPIAIYGDYDVDGVTATALLVQTLRALGADVREYIPNRFDEGYGLNKEALSALEDQGIRLVISVDCGIRSPDEANHARSIGLDLIISDHHEPAGELPNALAVINPKQPGDAYPEKYLAGVGIAYKIAQALHATFQPSNLQLDNLLDLVALGTVADLAPLTGENRVLVKRGLQQMRQSQRQGLLSLAGVAEVSLVRVNAMNIGFALGPRLNAAGRLDTALDAFNLLMTSDVSVAGQLALKLDQQNRQRQILTRDTQARAEALALGDDPDAFLLFAVDKNFNAGVVGLAAARLVESYARPAIVAEQGEEVTRGSCRSIAQFHITKALDQCADLLVRHGGHAAAAGFTVRNENLPAFVARIKSIAADQLSSLDLRPVLTADVEVPLSDLNPDLLKYLDALQPTGYGNPEAVFVSRGLRAADIRTVGADGKHLKLKVTDGKITYDAIAFRMGEWKDKMPARIDLMFTFESNEFNGRTTMQLNVKDLKPTGMPD